MFESEKSPETFVQDMDLAYDMAVAELPFRELESLAAHHGLSKIVSQMNGHANSASRRVQKAYFEEKRATAFDVITESGKIPAYTQDDFKRFWNGRGACVAFGWLAKQIEKNPDMPMRLVPVSEDEHVLQGDLLATLEWLRYHGKSAASTYNILRRIHEDETSQPQHS